MKKIAIAIAATLALSMAAAPAFATQVIMKDGKLSGGYTVNNGQFGAMKTNSDASVSLAMGAAEEGGWSAEAELGNLIGTPALGKYKIDFHDPLFSVTAWGRGYELSDKNDPFEFVKSNKVHDGALKVRAGVGPIVADFDNNANLYVFGEQALGNNTIGLAAHDNLGVKGNTTAVGYGKTQIANVTLTGAIGTTMNEGVTEENIGYGVKAEMPVLPTVNAAVTYKSEPTNFINNRNSNTLKAEATHEVDLVKMYGAYTHTVQASNGALKSNVIEAAANWRGSKQNQAWDDQFASDKYYTNVAPAIQANVKLTEDGTQPTKELTVKGTSPVIPGRAWVNGSLSALMDEDGTQTTLRNLADSADITIMGDRQVKMQADAYLKATDKLTLEPGMVVVKTQNDLGNASYLKLGSKAGYQVAPNGKLTAEYAKDFIDSEAHDSKLNFGYEVGF